MSLYDYRWAQQLEQEKIDLPFYGLVMCLVRKADTENLAKLRQAWPEVVAEMEGRYNSPGGVLPWERTAAVAPAGAPKIFVFCNCCSPQWHRMVAIAEDGTMLADHLCSDHAFALHDMGFSSDWKHEYYKKHYPNGFGLVWIDDFHEGMENSAEFAKAIKNTELNARAAEDPKELELVMVPK